MQWHEHTQAARMQLVVDDYLEGRAVSRDERDGVRREKRICGVCGNESFWVFYAPRHPIAGCNKDDCRLDARMGLFETLASVWDEAAWGELPEEKTERSRRLRQKLDEISAHYLQVEEAERREALEAERRGLRQAEENADKWKKTAGQWKSRSDQQEARAEGAENACGDLEAKLRRDIDAKALYRAISRATAAFAATVLFLGFFLGRADTGMLFDWNVFGMTLYLLAMSGPVWYVAYAMVHQEARRASEHNETPRLLHERLGIRIGVSWGWKILACVVVPYLLVDPIARSIGQIGWLASFLQPNGIEWLLLSTFAGLMCVLSPVLRIGAPAPAITPCEPALSDIKRPERARSRDVHNHTRAHLQALR